MAWKNMEASGSANGMPSLLEITELLRKQLDLPMEASAAAVVQRACTELEVPTQGLSLLGKARACWEQMGVPDVQQQQKDATALAARIELATVQLQAATSRAEGIAAAATAGAEPGRAIDVLKAALSSMPNSLTASSSMTGAPPSSSSSTCPLPPSSSSGAPAGATAAEESLYPSLTPWMGAEANSCDEELAQYSSVFDSEDTHFKLDSDAVRAAIRSASACGSIADSESSRWSAHEVGASSRFMDLALSR